MESTAASPLLCAEKDSKNQFYFDSDDDSTSSSGYDSCATSIPDYWSETEVESDEEDAAILDNDDVLVFENVKPIINTMEYILSMPSLCDVIFIVGQDKIELRGLKAVMASRNRQFCKLFIQEQEKINRAEKPAPKKQKFPVFCKKLTKTAAQQLVITIDNYCCDVFYKLILFLHLGQVSVTPETVVGLMCAAEEYDIPELQKACWDFSFRCLNNGNVATIVQSSKMYRHRLAASQLFSKLTEMSHGPKTTSV